MVGRFINADGYVSTGQGFIGYNMFTYCLNNPISYTDANGKLAFLAVLGVAAVVGLILSIPADNPDSVTAQKEVEEQYLDNKYNSDTVHIYTPQEKPAEGKINVLIDVNNTNNGLLDPNIHVQDSHKIRNKKEISKVMDVIMSSPEYDTEIFFRTEESYVNEWIAHNRIYDIAGLLGKEDWKNSAEHVDLNNLESRTVLWDLLALPSWG